MPRKGLIELNCLVQERLLISLAELEQQAQFRVLGFIETGHWQSFRASGGRVASRVIKAGSKSAFCVVCEVPQLFRQQESDARGSP